MPTIECPSCQVRLKVDDNAAGTEIACPKCQEAMTVPGAVSAASNTGFNATPLPQMPGWEIGWIVWAAGMIVCLISTLGFGVPELTVFALIGNLFGGSFLLFGIVRSAIEPLLVQNHVMSQLQQRHAQMIVWEIRNKK